MGFYNTNDRIHQFFTYVCDAITKAANYTEGDTSPMTIIPIRYAAERKSCMRVKHVVARKPTPTKEDIIQIFEAASKLSGQPTYYHFQYRDYLAIWAWGGWVERAPSCYLEWKSGLGEFEIIGNETFVNDALKLIKDKLPNTHWSTTVASAISDEGYLSTSQRLITLDRVSPDNHFPFMDKPLLEYFQEYMASKATVLLLIGPAGTGKTSFLRTMVLLLKLKALFAYNKDVIASAALYQRVLDDKYDLLALEDADHSIARREDGNDLMAALLNDSQGVGDASDLKVVISTNLSSLNSVDEALTRPGRCFDKLAFGLLSIDQANAIDRHGALGSELGAETGRKVFTLSEILNHKSYRPKTHLRSVMGFGQRTA